MRKIKNFKNAFFTIAAVFFIATGVVNLTVTTVNAQTSYSEEMSVCVFETR